MALAQDRARGENQTGTSEVGHCRGLSRFLELDHPPCSQLSSTRVQSPSHGTNPPPLGPRHSQLTPQTTPWQPFPRPLFHHILPFPHRPQLHLQTFPFLTSMHYNLGSLPVLPGLLAHLEALSRLEKGGPEGLGQMNETKVQAR